MHSSSSGYATSPYGAGVLLAASVDLGDVLERLAAVRPLFQSEADFQHAFAWQAHLADPNMRIRLETKPVPGLRLDRLFSSGDGRSHTAVDLKYLTGTWAGEIAGERYALKNHGAQDVRCYDVVKDVHRIESLVSERPDWNGAVVCLTNDPSYWQAPEHRRVTNADAFRLWHAGMGPCTGTGTSKGREVPVSLVRRHTIRWREFSRAGDMQFRVLVVEILQPDPATDQPEPRDADD